MVVASNSATHMFASSHLLREEDGKYISLIQLFLRMLQDFILRK